MKILILKPSSLGDVIQALPVLRLLKLHHPESRVWWWIDEDLAPLLQDDPDLAGLLLFPRRRWASLQRWPEIARFILHLRQHSFDWVLDLQSLARSGLVAWLARGRLTVGLDDRREGAPIFYDFAVRRPSPLAHAVDWYLEVLRTLNVPTRRPFDWIPARLDVTRSLQAKWRPEPGLWIALQPGARWDNKRWPASHFAELTRLLAAAQPTVRFAILGSSADRPLAATILAAAGSRGLDLTGQTTLPEMIEWLRRCDALVTNDTGPMHAAAALGRPVIGLFGPTEPRRTGPYGQLQFALQHRALPCVPCMKYSCHFTRPLECLTSLTPAAVAQVVFSRLASSSDPRPFSLDRLVSSTA